MYFELSVVNRYRHIKIIYKCVKFATILTSEIITIKNTQRVCVTPSIPYSSVVIFFSASITTKPTAFIIYRLATPRTLIFFFVSYSGLSKYTFSAPYILTASYKAGKGRRVPCNSQYFLKWCIAVIYLFNIFKLIINVARYIVLPYK